MVMKADGTSGESTLDQVGLVAFALGAVPLSVTTIDNASKNIIGADPDRAYVDVTLVSVTGGATVWAAQGGNAIVNGGVPLLVGETRRFFGKDRVAAILSGVQTSVIAIQAFILGERRIGDRL